jgi:hypothetical protein
MTRVLDVFEIQRILYDTMRYFTILTLLGGASAHAVFNGLFVNGKAQNQCIRAHNNNSPVTNVRSTDIRCNKGGVTGVPGVCSINVSLRFY